MLSYLLSFLQLERRGLFIHLQSLQLLLNGVKDRVNDRAINHTMYVLDNSETKCACLTMGVLLKLAEPLKNPAKTRWKVTFIAGRLGKGKCFRFLQIKHCSKKELKRSFSNFQSTTIVRISYSTLVSCDCMKQCSEKGVLHVISS